MIKPNRNIPRLSALLLAAVLLFSLQACSRSSGGLTMTASPVKESVQAGGEASGVFWVNFSIVNDNKKALIVKTQDCDFWGSFETDNPSVKPGIGCLEQEGEEKKWLPGTVYSGTAPFIIGANGSGPLTFKLGFTPGYDGAPTVWSGPITVNVDFKGSSS